MQLKPFYITLAPEIQLAGNIRLSADGVLQLSYQMQGHVKSLKIPPPTKNSTAQMGEATWRADELWKHTCFEAFISHGNEYVEINISPSGHWNAYEFSSYRKGMAQALAQRTHWQVDSSANSLLLTAGVQIEKLKLWSLSQGPLKASLTAAIEDQQGQLSHWALLHCREKPDFHALESFIFDLR